MIFQTEGKLRINYRGWITAIFGERKRLKQNISSRYVDPIINASRFETENRENFKRSHH